TAGINRLHDHILVEIFSLTSLLPFTPLSPTTWNGTAASTPPSMSSLEWVGLRLVCRSWRELADDTPSLWRVVTVKNDLDAMRFQLVKNANCSIDVVLASDADSNLRGLKLLTANAKRIRSVSTREGFQCKHLPSIKPLFKEPMPLLERVEIALGLNVLFANEEYDPDIGLTTFPHPHLRHVRSCGIALPPSPPFWSNVRTVDVDLKLDPSEQHPADHLLTILALTPRLTTL
ncbi:uncharacterized protein BXZ73DRAFT_36404, partial [Epithele typhae]|uniref:uncharacterized protein n=1 Tax=Epithele typhae TaxID=378194 RepID=UPI002007E75E